MPDIATISTFLTSIKSATEIAKAIKAVDSSLEKAETKLKIAELLESLADAKIQAVEIQEVIHEKDRRINELEEAFAFKSKLIRQRDAYYETDESGKPVGSPYCSHCWEVKHKAIHLNYGLHMRFRACPACNTAYENKFTNPIPCSS